LPVIRTLMLSSWSLPCARCRTHVCLAMLRKRK